MPSKFKSFWKGLKKRVLGKNRNFSSVEQVYEDGNSPLETVNASFFALAKEVFDDDLLREKILRYAILMSVPWGIISDPEDFRNLRLVQKSWLEMANRINREVGGTQILLTLDKHNSLNSSPDVQQNGKCLDQFYNIFGNSILANDGNFFLYLNLEEEFFHPENYESLSTCLVQYGSGLQVIDMEIPTNFDFLLPDQPLAVLPNLKDLDIWLMDKRLDTETTSEMEITSFIQTLLDNSPSIKKFSIHRSSTNAKSYSYLNLPSTLTSLNIKDVTIKPWNLAELLSNPLHNLTSLTLPEISYPNNLWFCILNLHRETLQKLKIHGSDTETSVESKSQLSFPVMKNLREFFNESGSYSLSEETNQKLQAFLPKLQKLTLDHLTVASWTAGSKLKSVRSLEVQPSSQSPFPLTLTMMKHVHHTFPRLNSLYLWIEGCEPKGLKYLFLNMTRLRFLTLHFYHLCHETNTTKFWEKLLTGTTMESLGKRKKHCGIKMLTELKSLSLITTTIKHTHGKPSLISDFTFTRGFMEMPNLHYLELRGRFNASTKAREQWIQMGRRFTKTLLPQWE